MKYSNLETRSHCVNTPFIIQLKTLSLSLALTKCVVKVTFSAPSKCQRHDAFFFGTVVFSTDSVNVNNVIALFSFGKF